MSKPGVIYLGTALGLVCLLSVAGLTATQEINQEDSARRRGQTTTREVRPFVPVTDEMLRNPDPGDWLMMNRTYDFQGYSPLDEINRDNVGRLQLAWMRAMDDGAPKRSDPWSTTA